ncbi:green heme protein [Chromatium weissei]|nr:green heme protein [Chromatium weissei]
MFYLHCIFSFFVTAGVIIFSTSAVAEDHAENLYQTHCLQCHSDEVYTRSTRRINAFDMLERQVKRCELSLGLQWFDKDIRAVALYLNVHFYHFLR